MQRHNINNPVEFQEEPVAVSSPVIPHSVSLEARSRVNGNDLTYLPIVSRHKLGQLVWGATMILPHRNGFLSDVALLYSPQCNILPCDGHVLGYGHVRFWLKERRHQLKN